MLLNSFAHPVRYQIIHFLINLYQLAQLRQHHKDRLDELMACCRQQAISAHDALPTIFKRALDVHQTTFAMGEAIAHLHMLWLSGQVTRLLGDDGIYRFRAPQS